MKKIVFTALISLASLFFGAGAFAANEEIPASDSKIVWIGRTLCNDGAVSGDWSGIYARISFKGDCLSARVSDTRKNYYNLWIDKEMWNEPDKIITLTGKDTTIVLLSKEEITAICGKKNAKPQSSHCVVLQKRTEGEQGTSTFYSFSTSGTFIPAPAPKERVIEFIGDSYTCGYGSENSIKTDPFKPETENCNKSYCNIVSRYFDAECVIVAHSGMGIARNYNDKFKDWYMPERYTQTFDMDRETKWSAASCEVKPSVTVIYLCTNDFSVGRQPSKALFKANYITLLKEIKANYGESHPILCVSGKRDFMMAKYIEEAVADSGLEAVSFAVLGPDIHDEDSDLGASFHPNYNGHIKKAYNLIPYISTLTGWSIEPAKPIR